MYHPPIIMSILLLYLPLKSMNVDVSQTQIPLPSGKDIPRIAVPSRSPAYSSMLAERETS